MGKNKNTKKRRCTVCRTLISEHIGPYGPQKCTMKTVASPLSVDTDNLPDPGQSQLGAVGGPPGVHPQNEHSTSHVAQPAATTSSQQHAVYQDHNLLSTSTNGQPMSAIGGNPYIGNNINNTAQNSPQINNDQTLHSTLNLLVSTMASMQTQLTSLQTANQQHGGNISQGTAMAASHPQAIPVQGPAVVNNALAADPHLPSSGVPYTAAFKQGDALPSLGGAVRGLRSAVGLTDMSSLFTIPGTPDKTLRQSLQGEYICLDEFLQNYSLNNSEAQDIQSYMDSDGNISYRNKRQKRRITSFNTWLEAWHNYERLLLSYHGFHLYDTCTKYKLLIMAYERKYNWTAVAILDMRHRLSLSGKSVEFANIDPVLFNSIMDPTTVKTSALRCFRCKSFDHTIGECPFPASSTQAPPKGGNRKQNSSSGPGQQEICNNYNNLRCVMSSCKRLHVCKACRGDLPFELCVKQGRCAATKVLPTT